ASLPPSRTRARIGLFGGSFDPPHSGHLHVAETAMKRLGLDQVWWFPTPGNPLKEAPSDYAARFEAVRDLTRHHRKFRVSNVEKQLNLRYTIDLVRLLKQRCREAQLVWIMGGDSLMTFHYWKDWRALTELVPIAVVARPGFEIAAQSSPFANALKHSRVRDEAGRVLLAQDTPAWVYLPAPLNAISSTQIRNNQ
ncbi:MAG: nicotinate (nicotinamide) nucleotide adenylyltransferase, partial [Pseudomonadota bacterium]